MNALVAAFAAGVAFLPACRVLREVSGSVRDLWLHSDYYEQQGNLTAVGRGLVRVLRALGAPRGTP